MASELRVTWLGHATVLLQTASGFRVLIDPFVQSNPSCPTEFHELDRLDVVAVTHAHHDHCGDAVALWRQCRPAAVVAMVETAHWLRHQGIDAAAVVEMNKGGSVRCGEVTITMTTANHSSSYVEGDMLRYAGEPAGLVLRFDDGPCVYHAGDTSVFGDMAIIGELYSPELVMLPIGDHYTMGPREAAKALELLGARRVLPIHWGTFPVLTGTPAALRRECAARGLQVDIIEARPGEPFA